MYVDWNSTLEAYARLQLIGTNGDANMLLAHPELQLAIPITQNLEA